MGLDLLGQRYYISKLGRFLNQDPIGHQGGLNLYVYCDNNPLKRVDPDGQDWDWAQYGKDVAGVLRGYKNALDLYRGLTGLARTLRDFAGHDYDRQYMAETGKVMASEFWTGLTGERGAEAFGESFGTTLQIAAPAIKKIPTPGIYSLQSYRLANVGGVTLLNVSKNGKSIFRIDLHRLPNQGYIYEAHRGKVRPHYHRTVGGIYNSIDVHRPFQHVKGQPRW